MLLLALLIFVGLSCEAFGEDEVWKRELNSSPVAVPLEVFQVEAPLRKSYGGTSCIKVIMQHDFTASYGSPYVGMAYSVSRSQVLIILKGSILPPLDASSIQ